MKLLISRKKIHGIRIHKGPALLALYSMPHSHTTPIKAYMIAIATHSTPKHSQYPVQALQAYIGHMLTICPYKVSLRCTGRHIPIQAIKPLYGQHIATTDILWGGSICGFSSSIPTHLLSMPWVDISILYLDSDTYN